MNALLGEERSIVTEISGTTRDAIHTDLRFEGRDILLVDTAGLRKRSRVSENVEFYSTLRTERAMNWWLSFHRMTAGRQAITACAWLSWGGRTSESHLW